MPLTCRKDLWSLPPDLHYLNCAYMSPLPRRVEEAGIEGVRFKRDPSRIVPADFFEPCDRVRALFAEVLGATDPSSIALFPSASYGLSTVARNLDVEPGQNFVVTHEQFPSNVYPWRVLVERAGVELRRVKPPDGATPRHAAWNESLLAAIDARTALVSLAALHWTDGTRFDLEAIGKRAREVGAAFVVDGTQSIGAMPFDLHAVQPDAVIVAGYKWLLAPYSTGLGWFGPRFLEGIPIEESWITRKNSADFPNLVHYQDEYEPGAIRFDAGERSNFILVPMLSAALELVLEIGAEDLQEYCRVLCRDMIGRMQERGFRVEDEAGRAHHLFGLRPPRGFDGEGFRRALVERRVSVSFRGDAIRVSPHVYNDAADVRALESLLEEFSPGGS